MQNKKMMKPIQYILSVTAATALILLSAAPAYSTQGHGAPEGLYVHQFSHLFFIFAMGILIYWLRSRSLVRESGWRYLQYACVFFLLWSLDAFCVHLLDEYMQWIHVIRIDPWRVQIDAPTGWQWLKWFYYIIKLDHLLCVPGMVFLFLGLRRLSCQPENEDNQPAQGGGP
ncbi:MAG: hypothetical protein K9J79_08110 [Desulfobacteraceae bacterium]|nr:hypothetical protein [Desulfobacteraceae bacterium]